MRVTFRYEHIGPDRLFCFGPVTVELGDGHTECPGECEECGAAFDEIDVERMQVKAAEVAEERRMYERTGR